MRDVINVDISNEPEWAGILKLETEIQRMEVLKAHLEARAVTRIQDRCEGHAYDFCYPLPNFGGGEIFQCSKCGRLEVRNV